MSLPKRYLPAEEEPRWQAFWAAQGSYTFSMQSEATVFSIDTPPATVSGNLHLGHVYSYTHTDLIARFHRMLGENVFYPMGYDNNGLATERLVEKRLGVRATDIGRQAFIEKCLQVSAEAEKDYQALWSRLGLSIDWRYTYGTNDETARRTSQKSFLDLYRQGLVYRSKAPNIWCSECRTAIAQAELEDLERESEYVFLKFRVSSGEQDLIIATTRPELLPACVAIFVHPDDARYRHLIGNSACVPYFGQTVPILADPAADPEKGTGAVMCCTFGDATDVEWWYAHQLPVVEAIDPDGRLNKAAGPLAGLPVPEARQKIIAMLSAEGFLLDRQPTVQSVRVHERCDTPVEYILAAQWFIRILPYKADFLKAGEQLNWFPGNMKARYTSWVENLTWDWCISRQRYSGVPIPVWYCADCDEVILADERQLPVDPLSSDPPRACACGSSRFSPEKDILDTWATSSMSPQIVGGWITNPQLYASVFPFSMRPQAHEIIRTWTFYTIAKSHFHFGCLPWKDVAISGWGIAGEGMGKISKSRGGGPLPPMEMIERYSADAVRYWAASTGPGKDAIISEEKIQSGSRLVTKLWNVARFADLATGGLSPAALRTSGVENQDLPPAQWSPADRWILARTQRLIRRVTGLLQDYDYAAAKSEIESFFWQELADNYLEMCKQRLYGEDTPLREGARQALTRVLFVVIQLFAPFLPHVTEAIYQGLFAGAMEMDQATSIHTSRWPAPEPSLEDEAAEAFGAQLVEVATAVRRYKSERSLPLGSELERLGICPDGASPELEGKFRAATADLSGVTRAKQVEICRMLDPQLVALQASPTLRIGIG